MKDRKRKDYPISIFGIDHPNFTIQGFEECCIPAPAIDDGYVFRKDVVRDLANFIDCSFGDGLMIFGPKGSGKTSVVEQFLARIKYPFYSITCKGSDEIQSWVGMYVYVNGEMLWKDGFLTEALKKGYALIINEIDVVDPGELSALNGILSGSPLVIPETMEVVYPHRDFRLVVCTNTNGQGSSYEDGEVYTATQIMSPAFLDRFLKIHLGYMDKEDEVKMVKSRASLLPDDIIEKMVELANKVRVSQGTEYQLSLSFSTRTLVRWAIQMQRLQGMENLLSYTLDRVLLNGAPNESEKIAIRSIAESIFGNFFND